MSPEGVDKVLDRLTRIEVKLDQVQTDATEIKTQAKLTNGRVTDLELSRAKVYGALAFIALVVSVYAAVRIVNDALGAI